MVLIKAIDYNDNDLKTKRTDRIGSDNVITVETKEAETEEVNDESNEEHLIAEEDNSDLDVKHESSEEPVIKRELTEKERLAINLYESAQSMLNASRSDRAKAFQLMVESAKLDYEPAMELVAKQHLFGDDLPIDLTIAKNYLTRLSIKGNANSQLVCLNF